MSYMHISIPSTPTSMDTNSLASPRNELISILQKEQDEALALLEANPFISSLLVKYSKGGATKATPSENEELVALKAEMNAIRQDYARLFTDFETVKQQKKAAETISVGLEIQLASAVEEKKKGTEEIESLKKSLSQTEAEFFNAQDALTDAKLKSEQEIVGLRRELSETKENAVKESARAASEIKSLKNRCDVLWETISERRPDFLQLALAPPAEVVKEKGKERESEPQAQCLSEEMPKVPVLSVKPPVAKSKKSNSKFKGSELPRILSGDSIPTSEEPPAIVKPRKAGDETKKPFELNFLGSLLDAQKNPNAEGSVPKKETPNTTVPSASIPPPVDEEDASRSLPTIWASQRG